MNIAIRGLFGSGKTTLAGALATKFDLTHFSSSNLKEYADLGKPGYKEIKKCMGVGVPIPRDIWFNILKDSIHNLKNNGLVIDNVMSAEFVKQVGKVMDINKWIYLKIDEDIAKQRVLSRARNDLSDEFLKNRLERFHSNTEEFEKVLGNKLLTFDATLPISVLHKQVFEAVSIK